MQGAVKLMNCLLEYLYFYGQGFDLQILGENVFQNFYC